MGKRRTGKKLNKDNIPNLTEFAAPIAIGVIQPKYNPIKKASFQV